MGRDLNIQPALAESYEAAPDATSYLFYLRQGVTFHDGRPMTAADVKYSLDLTLNPPAPVVASPYLANVKEVVVVDDATVRIDMTKPDPTIPGILAWQRLTPIFPNGIADEINLLSEGIGTGPFKLIEYISNERLSYEAFTDYWETGRAVHPATHHPDRAQKSSRASHCFAPVRSTVATSAPMWLRPSKEMTTWWCSPD